MKKVPLLLVLAIVIAFIFRFWHLTSLPFPPDGDETAFGYYGWSLLHFGMDEYGKVLPTSFNSIGDFKYPGIAYLNIIPAAIFGLSSITTRFWSATAGVLLVIIVYLLCSILFNKRNVSIFSAWFIALSPWAIIESRLGYESMVCLTIVTAGIVVLLYFVRTKDLKLKRLLFIIVFLLFVLATFTYAAARLFLPGMLLTLVIFSFIKGNPFKENQKYIIILFVSISLIVLSALLSPANRGRASEDIWQGVTASESNRLQELYVQAGTSAIKIPARVTWFFQNKYRIAVFDFLERYTTHFSFNYLFLNGEASLQRIPDMGVLLLADMILLPFGIVSLLKNKEKYSVWIMFIWLIIAPIPSSIATGEARMNRAVFMIVPFAIISGLGVTYLIDLFKGKIRYVVYLLFLVGIATGSFYSLNQIFIQKPLDKPWYKQTVNEELTKSIISMKDNYKAVVTGDGDYIFFLFYEKLSPSEFIKSSEILPLTQAKWNRVIRLDNIYFNMPYNCPKGGKLDVLYVCKGVEVPQNANVIKAIYYPDGVPAYSLITFYPVSSMPPSGHLPTPPDKFQYMVDVEHKYPDGIIPVDSVSFW